MDLGLSIGIGLVILGIGLYSKKWAGLVSIFAFFPYLLAAVMGILGFDFSGAGSVGGQIAGTYLLGVGLGWLPHFIANKKSIKTRN
jgi:hypothetical protein